MIDSKYRDYYDKKSIKLIESIGYINRFNKFILFEQDGYIYITFYILNDWDKIISFNKYYQIKNDINVYSKEFLNFEKFENFIKEYHKKLFRKLKLKNLL